jgi:AraC-like DNA-binding protein
MFVIMNEIPIRKITDSLDKISSRIEMDRFSPIFAHFTLSARVFYSGRLCGASSDHKDQNTGYLHVVRRGTFKVIQPNRKPVVIGEPSVLLFPRPRNHRLWADETTGADIVCAAVEFGSGMLNPLVRALPDVFTVPLKSVPELAPTIDLLFAEAFGDRLGRQAAVDRLTEYFLILLLRSAIKAELIKGGVLLGLADARLANAISAIHDRPEHPWSLEELANAAGMSRARFALHFRNVVGVTPFDYLVDWRIGVAQSLLKRGQPLKIVAPSVGYASSAALTRAFNQRIGVSPKAWLRYNQV